MKKQKKQQMDIDDFLNSEEIVDMETGEISVVDTSELNKLIVHETKRPDGSVRIQFDYSNCPSMAEQGTGHLSDVNWLIEKYQPDELERYIAAKNMQRMEIVGHDFSREPNLQNARNIVYRSSQEFEKLPEDIRVMFKSHVEFLKFLDNPANAEKMIKLGILKPKQIENLKSLEPVKPDGKTPTTTKEEEKDKK